MLKKKLLFSDQREEQERI